MKIILFGPPGGGKGTQASLIKEKYGIAHISTGDIFRTNIKNNTELGKLANSYIAKGELVPDSVTIDLVRDRLTWDDCKNGFILDGFPRNVAQAEALEKMTDLDAAILIDQKYDVIIPRLAGRRACRGCGETLHTDWLNGQNACPKCGGEIYQRDDDKEEVIKNRLKEYEKQTAPLIDYYKNKGLLKVVNAANDIADTFEIMKNVLETLKV